MKIGLAVPDLTWPNGPASLGAELAAVAKVADEVGFDSLSVMDHYFQVGAFGPPEHDMLEAYTTLGFLAAHTNRIKLLTVITGVVYRHPGLLAKIVSTLDVLSGGRAMLGIGAAWNAEESVALGVPFPGVAERFERLEETLQICLRMWSADETPYQGRHYSLARPMNVPQPLRRPPIMVGGMGERKTLRLVARYADACNVFAGPEVEHKLSVLRSHCLAEGRDYDTIEKTVYLQFDPSRVSEQLAELASYASLGVATAIGHVPSVWDVSALEKFGNELIPAAAELSTNSYAPSP
jgi:F420-dependent oxidoreductase-like protein